MLPLHIIVGSIVFAPGSPVEHLDQSWHLGPDQVQMTGSATLDAINIAEHYFLQSPVLNQDLRWETWPAEYRKNFASALLVGFLEKKTLPILPRWPEDAGVAAELIRALEVMFTEKAALGSQRNLLPEVSNALSYLKQFSERPPLFDRARRYRRSMCNLVDQLRSENVPSPGWMEGGC